MKSRLRPIGEVPEEGYEGRRLGLGTVRQHESGKMGPDGRSWEIGRGDVNKIGETP